MITRRMVILGSAATAAGIALGRAGSFLGATTQTPVNFAVPAGAFDCHSHVLGDPAKFPFAPGAMYPVGTATAEDSIALHKALHVDRIVLVQPSFYGADFSCMFDGMRKMGPRTRGIALIDEKTTESQLDEMHRAGVRGVRLNFQMLARTGKALDAAAVAQMIQTTVKQFGGRKWHIQILTQLADLDSFQNEIMNSPVPIVIDHFGAAKPGIGIDQPGFRTMLKLVHEGKAYVKLSATYHVAEKPDYSDVAPLAMALIDANPRRTLWGTNWFHPIPATLPGHEGTGVGPNPRIDNGLLLNVLADWAPDPAVRKLILVENPARLFDA
jgi:predicted TIM-barrel fold metal-dependent hydrolase